MCFHQSNIKIGVQTPSPVPRNAKQLLHSIGTSLQTSDTNTLHIKFNREHINVSQPGRAGKSIFVLPRRVVVPVDHWGKTGLIRLTVRVWLLNNGSFQ